MSVSVIALINESSIAKEQDAVTMAAAVGRQIRKHCAPAWGRSPAAVLTAPAGTPLPEAAVPIYLLDDADQADALGYHDEDPQGRQYGRVFVRTVLGAGGELLTGDTSVASVFSHEALEWFIDPTCRTWDGPADEAGHFYAREVGDPVESETYVMPTHGIRVTVSNFVFPEWFDPSVAAGSGLDYLGSTHEPFSLSKGGYAITLQDGKYGQVFSEQLPAWRQESKQHPASRTSRRRAHIEAITGRDVPRPSSVIDA